jgi:hypothetical protein
MRNRSCQRRMAPILFVSLLFLAAPFRSASAATVLQATEHQITSGSDCYNTTPILGSDASGPFVVWTKRVLTSYGLGHGSIYYQRLTTDGVPSGDPVLVSLGGTDDELPDVSGTRIVYTAYDPNTANSISIIVYDLATGTNSFVAQGSDLRGARIFGNWVAWVEGRVLTTNSATTRSRHPRDGNTADPARRSISDSRDGCDRRPFCRVGLPAKRRLSRHPCV